MYPELKAAWAELTAPGQMFEVETVTVGGAPTRSYKHAPPSLREVWLSSAAHGDAEYLVFRDERCSYTQAREYVASIAAWLRERGVEPGDRVAIAMRNYPEWMLSYWAVTAMGAVVVGMNAWWVAGEMRYALDDAAPKVLICDRERLQRFAEIREHYPQLAVAAVRMEAPVPDWATEWMDVVNTAPALPEVAIAPDDDACIFYTSGTTGHPKGARLTHRGCVNNILNLAFINAVQPLALAKAGLPGGEAAGQPPEPPVSLLATPLFHVTGNNCVAQATTVAGGKLVHMYKWDPAEALALIERERVTVFNAVPMMAREIIGHPDFARRDTASLKTLGGGGAALQPDLVAKIDTSGGARPNTGYGMTETCGIIAAISSAFFVGKPASVGPAMPTFEAQCVDPEGRALPAGEVGELWVRGAPVIKGYLNRPEATAESITDGWLHTGDIAWIDDDGFIYLVDRAKDMVLRGGENVYCAEVENALFAQDAVAECVVFAVADERLGEEVGAAVYLRPGAHCDATTLRAHCAGVLAPYKVPRYIWLLDAPIPRNANGKFLKRELRESLPLAEAG